MTLFDYQVIFQPTGATQDITDFAERVEWSEVGTGEVRSCTIRLNAQDGQFITRATQQGTNKATPILVQFDKIQLNVTDRLGTQRFYVFEVDTLKPIQNAQQGAILEVQMLGLENQLMKVNFAKPFFLDGGASGFKVGRDIIDFYNDGDSKGPNQPLVIGNAGNFVDNGSDPNLGFNELPIWTANEYHFELTEQSAYDGEVILADRLGSSVAAGGAGDFFEIYFTTGNNRDQIVYKGFISGNPPTQQTPEGSGIFDFTKAITIDDTVAINPAEEEGGIQSIVGNVVGTWGGDGTGTNPTLNSNFKGALEIYPLFPFHVPGTTYPTDAFIQINTASTVDDFNEHYRANTTTTQTPPSAEWDLVNFGQYLISVGSTGIYSLWTNSRKDEWKSSGAKVDGTELDDPPVSDSLKVWDCNQVVIDGTFSRTWVHTVQTISSNVPTEMLYNNTAGEYYRGFRVLVNGTGSGDFAGFTQEIIRFDGNQFTTFRDPGDDAMCADDDEGRMFQKQSGSWLETNQDKIVDCYHPVFSITNTQGHNNTSNGAGGNGAIAVVDTVGILTDIVSVTVNNGGTGYSGAGSIDISFTGTGGFGATGTATVSGGAITAITVDEGGFGYPTFSPEDITVNISDRSGNYGGFSAVTYEFRYSQTDIVSFNTPTFYRVYAGMNFQVPFPKNSFNFNTLGEFYGNNSTKKEPVTFDITNMHLTHSGKVGFNNSEAEDLGPFDALTFVTKFEMNRNRDASGGLTQNANFACRCFMVDTDDNVLVQDFTIPFNDLWQPIQLPVNQFKIFRGRKPITFQNIVSNVFLQQLEILQRFRYHNIQKIGLMWLGSFDDSGRYNPISIATKALFPDPLAVILGFATDGYNIKWSVDSFEWSKAGLAMSSPVQSITAENLGRAIQPRFFDEPLITNKIQLDQSNTAKFDLANFQQKRFDTVTEGILNIDFGDSYFLENEFIVNDSDKPDGGGGFVPNTIKLVAKKLTYVIDKPPTGRGGFLRTIEGARRIEE